MKKQNILIKDLESEFENLSTKLVQYCCRFDSTIKVEEFGKMYNAKSIFSTMKLRLEPGEVVTVYVEGNDEEYVMMQLIHFLGSVNKESLGGVI